MKNIKISHYTGIWYKVEMENLDIPVYMGYIEGEYFQYFKVIYTLRSKEEQILYVELLEVNKNDFLNDTLKKLYQEIKLKSFTENYEDSSLYSLIELLDKLNEGVE